jgi:hypothetical protein
LRPTVNFYGFSLFNMGSTTEEQLPLTASAAAETQSTTQSTTPPAEKVTSGINGTAKPTTDEKHVEECDVIPSAAVLKKCADIPVYDADGKEHTFKSLVEGDGSGNEHLIVFIRHFLCGVSSAPGTSSTMGHQALDIADQYPTSSVKNSCDLSPPTSRLPLSHRPQPSPSSAAARQT